jgi:hypothetical protein
MQDAGEYRCVIRNDFGEDSCVMRLECSPEASIIGGDVPLVQHAAPAEVPEPQISGQPPVFSKTLPAQQQYLEGDHLQLHAQLLYASNVDYEVHWLFNEKPLPTGHRYRAQPPSFGTCYLQILDLGKGDSGVYTCRAINQFGTAETSCTVTCTGKNLIFYIFT